jgi:hypothetical protein
MATTPANAVIAVAEVYRSASQQYASATTVIAPAGFGRETGPILLERFQNAKVVPARVPIPVELYLPEKGP